MPSASGRALKVRYELEKLEPRVIKVVRAAVGAEVLARVAEPAVKTYNVRMPRVTATAARRDLFHLLDAAEKGEEVILERRGARFRLSLEPSNREKTPPSPLIIEDPDVLAGDWTWRADAKGELTFQPRRQ